MSRAVFAPVSFKGAKPPNYYLHKRNNTVWWKVKESWYRMYPDGSCGHCYSDFSKALGDPDTRPVDYEPRYGAFTIIINPDEED